MLIVSFLAVLLHAATTPDNLFSLSVDSNGEGDHTPVVIVHGIFAHAWQYTILSDDMSDFIFNETGTRPYILRMELKNGAIYSFTPLGLQVDLFAQLIAADPHLQDGFNLVCHSQGGLICRGYVEKYNSPKVKRLVTLGGVNAGMYIHFPWYLRMLDVFYNDFVQNRVSFATYWKDPFNRRLYLKYSSFLADINNERDYNETYRQNLASLDGLVMLGSPDDGIIQPWQSTVGGFYKQNSLEIEDLPEQEIYRKDLCGYKTLDEQGRLVRIVVSNVTHINYIVGPQLQIVEASVFPYLLDTFIFPPRKD